MDSSENPDLAALAASCAPSPRARSRNGKVARLPKAVRDRLNDMLLDGFSYNQIIESLGPDAKDVNEDNLSKWRTGGYQDWLRDQQRIDEIRARQEFALDLVCHNEGNQLHQATLQIAATNLCELLVDLDPASQREELQKNPDKYARLLNAISRLSDGELRRDRHRADKAEREAEREAKLAKDKSPSDKRGISDESLKKAEDRLNIL